MNWSHTNF